jgi:hypothetical protein
VTHAEFSLDPADRGDFSPGEFVGVELCRGQDIWIRRRQHSVVGVVA